VLAAQALHQLGGPADKSKLAQAIEQVAGQLGNTKAVCRKCYIHPAVIDAYLEGRLARAMNGGSVEACVQRLLKRRPKRETLEATLARSLRRLRRGTQLAGAAAIA
jgi:DNA topoisomerase-1